MIRFEQVAMRFPRQTRPAIADCSFTVEPGELVVLIGPSGCGKTTLLKLVNRLYEATTGNIYLKGTNIRQLPVTSLRRQIGYVIQQSGLFPHMTVAQNIAVVPKLLGWNSARIDARVVELLSLIQLPAQEYRDRYPAQLSGGQQQRVGLARALAANPEVMLMDEPFGALDAITRNTLQDEILSLQRQLRKTILFVSHDIEEALRLGDRILVLDRGQIVQYDTPLNLLVRPANAFVRELVGAGDRVRLLSVLPVSRAIQQVPELEVEVVTELPAIASQDSLRNALSLLLQTGATQLNVMAGEVSLGVTTLEQIQTTIRQVVQQSSTSSYD